MVRWLGITGNGFLRVFWDPTHGPKMNEDNVRRAIEGDSDPAVIEDKLKKIDAFIKRGGRLGDLEIEAVSPYAIDVDPYATSLDDCRYIVDTRVRTRDYVRDRWKIDKPASDAEAADSATLNFLEEIRMLDSTHYGRAASTIEPLEDGVLEHCLYVKPCYRAPQGMMAVVVNGKVVQQAPLQTSRIPYMHVKDISMPGRFWATSIIEQGLSPQREFNEDKAFLSEHRDRMGLPKYLSPIQGQIPPDAFRGPPGEAISYHYPFKPDVLPAATLPEYILQMPELSRGDLEDVTAQRDATHGRNPAGVRAATALTVLREADDSILSDTVASLAEAYIDSAKAQLELLSKNVRLPRLVQSVGDVDNVESLIFSGMELLDENGDIDFEIDLSVGRQLPKSRAMVQELIIQLLNLGVLNPQLDRNTILESLDIGTDINVFSDLRIDRRAQMAEIYRMIGGEDVAINTWDNDEAHLQAIEQFQKTDKNQQVMAQDPSFAPRLEAHKQMHVKRMQLIMQIQSGGKPPGGPAPGEPPQPAQQ
jgi:hypothetical protein